MAFNRDITIFGDLFLSNFEKIKKSIQQKGKAHLIYQILFDHYQAQITNIQNIIKTEKRSQEAIFAEFKAAGLQLITQLCNDQEIKSFLKAEHLVAIVQMERALLGDDQKNGLALLGAISSINASSARENDAQALPDDVKSLSYYLVKLPRSPKANVESLALSGVNTAATQKHPNSHYFISYNELFEQALKINADKNELLFLFGLRLRHETTIISSDDLKKIPQIATTTIDEMLKIFSNGPVPALNYRGTLEYFMTTETKIEWNKETFLKLLFHQPGNYDSLFKLFENHNEYKNIIPTITLDELISTIHQSAQKKDNQSDAITFFNTLNAIVKKRTEDSINNENLLKILLNLEFRLADTDITDESRKTKRTIITKSIEILNELRRRKAFDSLTKSDIYIALIDNEELFQYFLQNYEDPTTENQHFITKLKELNGEEILKLINTLSSPNINLLWKILEENIDKLQDQQLKKQIYLRAFINSNHSSNEELLNKLAKKAKFDANDIKYILENCGQNILDYYEILKIHNEEGCEHWAISNFASAQIYLKESYREIAKNVLLNKSDEIKEYCTACDFTDMIIAAEEELGKEPPKDKDSLATFYENKNYFSHLRNLGINQLKAIQIPRDITVEENFTQILRDEIPESIKNLLSKKTEDLTLLEAKKILEYKESPEYQTNKQKYINDMKNKGESETPFKPILEDGAEVKTQIRSNISYSLHQLIRKGFIEQNKNPERSNPLYHLIFMHHKDYINVHHVKAFLANPKVNPQLKILLMTSSHADLLIKNPEEAFNLLLNADTRKVLPKRIKDQLISIWLNSNSAEQPLLGVIEHHNQKIKEKSIPNPQIKADHVKNAELTQAENKKLAEKICAPLLNAHQLLSSDKSSTPYKRFVQWFTKNQTPIRELLIQSHQLIAANHFSKKELLDFINDKNIVATLTTDTICTILEKEPNQFKEVTQILIRQLIKNEKQKENFTNELFYSSLNLNTKAILALTFANTNDEFKVQQEFFSKNKDGIKQLFILANQATNHNDDVNFSKKKLLEIAQNPTIMRHLNRNDIVEIFKNCNQNMDLDIAKELWFYVSNPVQMNGDKIGSQKLSKRELKNNEQQYIYDICHAWANPKENEGLITPKPLAKWLVAKTNYPKLPDLVDKTSTQPQKQLRTIEFIYNAEIKRKSSLGRAIGAPSAIIYSLIFYPLTAGLGGLILNMFAPSTRPTVIYKSIRDKIKSKFSVPHVEPVGTKDTYNYQDIKAFSKAAQLNPHSQPLNSSTIKVLTTKNEPKKIHHKKGVIATKEQRDRLKIKKALFNEALSIIYESGQAPNFKSNANKKDNVDIFTQLNNLNLIDKPHLLKRRNDFINQKVTKAKKDLAQSRNTKKKSP